MRLNAYWCNSLPRPKQNPIIKMQQGWTHDGKREMLEWVSRISTEKCMYDNHATDARCAGCNVPKGNDMTEAKCELCGEPMPAGETMFKYHGYSGPCPKPTLPQPASINWQERATVAEADAAALRVANSTFATDHVCKGDGGPLECPDAPCTCVHYLRAELDAAYAEIRKLQPRAIFDRAVHDRAKLAVKP